MPEKGAIHVRIAQLLGLLIPLFALVPSTLALAETWQVYENQVDPIGRVGAVVDSAASGDSILIHPGLYFEHIPLDGKDLVLIGTNGASATTLSGSMEVPGSEGSVFFSIGSSPGDITIEGLRIANGSGSSGPFGSHVGGGVAFWGDSQWGNRLTLRDCIVEDNGTGYEASGSGGGVYVAQARSAVFERCTFRNNSVLWTGGAVSIEGTTEQVTFEACRFELDETAGSGGAGIWSTGSQPVVVRQCIFEADAISEGYSAIVLLTWSMTLEQNIFIDLGEPLATCLRLGYGSNPPQPTSLNLRANAFWQSIDHRPDTGNPTILISAEDVAVESNSLHACGIHIVMNAGQPITFSSNIVYRGVSEFYCTPGGILSCNDFYPEGPLMEWGSFTQADNISADPLFCEEGDGDVEIASNSPCTEENAPPSCGRIGVGDVACETTAVEFTTLGRIRTLFR